MNKKCTELTLNLSLHVIGDSNDELIFHINYY